MSAVEKKRNEEKDRFFFQVTSKEPTVVFRL